MLVEKQMEMKTIYASVRKTFPFTHIIFSTDNSENMIMRIYIRNIFDKKGITLEKIETFVDSLFACTVRGIKGINATYVKEGIKHIKQDDGSIKSDKIFYIFADGTNLKDIMMNPWIDKSAVRSDSILEVFRHCGIEAARSKIIHEIFDQIEGAASYRHCSMYADEMTFNGIVTSIDRYGSEKRDSSFMLRISDASPIMVIENSAINNKTDMLKGVSPPIMVGRNPNIGDLYNTFKLDEEFVAEFSENLEDLLDDL